ncbi:ABC transporter permease [Nocardioides zeae]|uniref:Peptide/nickel transport system permease protein n=1 Tax=Nocardioides zeae TaxID=1457234 RepID=A0AAJ1U1W9_9ACTN|nr:ABC transporter permease [Nocardioides zeae]MDQ1103001.1 peptide/nickel transport system permease protein [Nocardioides zeae]
MSTRLPWAAGAVLVLLAAFALAPQLFAPEGPYAEDIAQRLQAPSASHPFGTDELGRDLLARVVHGTRTTLGTSLLALAVATTLALAVGGVAGYVRGRTDRVLMLGVDALLALPALLVSLLIVFALGSGTLALALAVGLASVPAFARLTRAEVLRVDTQPFTEAARAFGVPGRVVLARHVLPHTVRPLVALAAVELAAILLTVSVLGFLGYGATPPHPEWGTLVAEGRRYFVTAWWLTALPGIVLVVLVLSLHRVGRWLTDRTPEWAP